MAHRSQTSDFLPRSFESTASERRRWRRVMEWSGSTSIYKLLKTIEVEMLEQAGLPPNMRRRTWLLKYRANFRWIFQFGRIAPIKLYVSECPGEMLPVALWLWGRRVSRFETCGLSAFIHDPSPIVRKHVARSMRRLQAWSLLREMAATYPDEEKVCRFAGARIRRPFVDRLKNFTSRVDAKLAAEVAKESRMPFWSQERSWQRTPPKSVEFIRRMLRRIHGWVHGTTG